MDMKRYEQRLKIMLNEPGLFKRRSKYSQII